MTIPSRLSLATRDVGRVTIIHCNGRIVAGTESESLRAHVTWLLRDRRSIVLHLGEVAFIDSSGLGTIVRSLASTRRVYGDLKLCNVPEHVRKVLALSHLSDIFDTHDSEENAVAAFYKPAIPREDAPASGLSILCVDANSDVLSFLRELLTRAGHEVHTTSHLNDALVLMRITKFDLLLAGPDVHASPAAKAGFQAACAVLPVIELGSEFCTQDAGEAGARLLARIGAQLIPKTAQN